MQETTNPNQFLKIVSPIGYLRKAMNELGLWKTFVFTSNKQSKLYYPQVSKYPCNSKMISTPHKYRKIQLTNQQEKIWQ